MPSIAMDADTLVLNAHAHHLRRIDEELNRSLNSSVPQIEEMARHILFGPGKRLRPLFFVLAARLCRFDLERAYPLSILFEYLHCASLLHDDVLDHADLRRSRPSANRIWGDHAALLAGDFLYARFFAIATDSGNLAFVRRLQDMALMVEGQMQELVHTWDWRLSRAAYMEIIQAKTAVLISAACACGAIIAEAGPAAEEALGAFGLRMGIAFQLMDDLLDYTSSEHVFGKPVGKDLREGKITLPLIYTLELLDGPERERWERIFSQEALVETDYEALIDLVRTRGALARVQAEARNLVAAAARSLDCFPDSPAKQDLLDLNDYIVNRTY